MASEWPAWVWHYYDEAHELRGQQPWLEEDDCGEMEPYLHRDAARAWQAFRDWCDGTAEQWQAKVIEAKRTKVIRRDAPEIIIDEDSL